MESFTSTFGIFSSVILIFGMIIIVVDFFLPKKNRVAFDNQIKNAWIWIDDRKVSVLVNKYSLRIINLYSSPTPVSKGRKHQKGSEKKRSINKKNVVIFIAFALPLIALIVINTNVQDNFIFFNFPNLFDQYYTVSGNISIVVASGTVNLLIFKLLEKTFGFLAKTKNLKSLWAITIIALFFLGLTEAIMTVITSFFFHIFFSIEIFFFPNIPPYYLWNPDLSFDRFVSYQWNPEIFVLQGEVFLEDIKLVADTLLFFLLFAPQFYLFLYQNGGFSLSPFLIDALSLLLGYLPLMPAIFFLILATLLLFLKKILSLTSLLLTSLVEYIMNKEISEEDAIGKKWVERKEYDPTLRFIGKQLVNFGVILLAIFAVLAYFYPLT